MNTQQQSYDEWAKLKNLALQSRRVRYAQPQTTYLDPTAPTTTSTLTYTYQQPVSWQGTPSANWVNGNGPNLPPPRLAPKPKSRLEQIIDRARMVFPSNGLKPTKVVKPAGLIERMFPDGVIPPIAGAAAEAEVDVSEDYRPETPVTPPKPTPARKKITLTQKVGTVRDKDGVSKPIHKGSVELVRQLTGPAHETECVGIKVEHTDSSNHVEIPLGALEEAIFRLRKNRDTSGDRGGRFFGK